MYPNRAGVRSPSLEYIPQVSSARRLLLWSLSSSSLAAARYSCRRRPLDSRPESWEEGRPPIRAKESSAENDDNRWPHRHDSCTHSPPIRFHWCWCSASNCYWSCSICATLGVDELWLDMASDTITMSTNLDHSTRVFPAASAFGCRYHFCRAHMCCSSSPTTCCVVARCCCCCCSPCECVGRHSPPWARTPRIAACPYRICPTVYVLVGTWEHEEEEEEERRSLVISSHLQPTPQLTCSQGVRVCASPAGSSPAVRTAPYLPL